MEPTTIAALGLPALIFGAAHVGLTQLIRTFARWRKRPIRDSLAVMLSLAVGFVLGLLMLGGVAGDAGVELPRPWNGGVMGVILAGVNSGLIAKVIGFQKDGARYRAQADAAAAAVVLATPLPPAAPLPTTEGLGDAEVIAAQEAAVDARLRATEAQLSDPGY